MRERLGGVLATEDLCKAVGQIRLRRFGQLVERRRVDQVAARIAEQPRLEVEVAQRAAAGVLVTAGGEVGGEGGLCRWQLRQRRLAGEQQVLQQRLALALDAAHRALRVLAGIRLLAERVAEDLLVAQRAARSVGGTGEAVVRLDLMREHEQRDRVAAWREVDRGVLRLHGPQRLRLAAFALREQR